MGVEGYPRNAQERRSYFKGLLRDDDDDDDDDGCK